MGKIKDYLKGYLKGVFPLQTSKIECEITKQKKKLNKKMIDKVNRCKIESKTDECRDCIDYRFCPIKKWEAKD